MAGFLRKSTSATIRMGPYILPADGYSSVAGATLAPKLAKAGGALAARSDATAITHDADGYYLVTLNATDTNTVGRLRLETAGAAGYFPVSEDFTVLDAAVYDVLFGSAAPSTYAGADTSGTTTLLSRVPGVVQPQTGDAFARLGAPAGASIAADIAAVSGGGSSGTQLTLDSGTVSAATSGAAFSSATTALDTTTGAYKTMALYFTSGANAGQRRTILNSTRTGGTTAFTFTGANSFAETPGVGDAFVIG